MDPSRGSWWEFAVPSKQSGRSKQKKILLEKFINRTDTIGIQARVMSKMLQKKDALSCGNTGLGRKQEKYETCSYGSIILLALKLRDKDSFQFGNTATRELWLFQPIRASPAKLLKNPLSVFVQRQGIKMAIFKLVTTQNDNYRRKKELGSLSGHWPRLFQ